MSGLYKHAVCLLLVAIVSLGGSSDPRVTTGVGEIIGIRGETEFDGRTWMVDRYLGIPYAEAPVGQRRFQKPVPKAPFDTPFEAKDYGHSCIQLDYPGQPPVGKISEDCLMLNVFVPVEVSEKPAGGFPVMIFIHGGGFVIGSSNLYYADTLTGFGEVIVVTINYRLGMLGFLNIGSEGAIGNYGLWDQHLAFQWVHNHIAAFGGDSEKVTVFGQSAGSTSVALQSLFPENKGLFQRVIGDSGAATTLGMAALNDVSLSRFLAKEFGCDLPEDTTSKEVLACLRQVSAADILAKMAELMKDPQKAMIMRFSPSIDNDLFKVPISSLLELKDSENVSPEEAMLASVDLMLGVNAKEGGVFVGPGGGVQDIEGFVVERATMDTMYVPLALSMPYPTTDTSALRDLVSAQYTDWDRPNQPEALRDMFVDMMGDVLFVVPSIKMSRKHANLTNAGKTFFYHFCTEPSTHLIESGTWLKGSNHGDEMGYVFGFPLKFIDSLSSNRTFIVENWEIEHSKAIMTSWTNFAKSGDPNQPVDIRQYIKTQWPEFDLQDERYLEMDRLMSAESVKSHLRAEVVNFWSKIIPGLMQAIEHRGEQPGDKYTSDGEGTCTSPDGCSP